MKKFVFPILAIASLSLVTSCSNDDDSSGNGDDKYEEN